VFVVYLVIDLYGKIELCMLGCRMTL